MARKGNNIYHRKDGRWEGRYYYKGTRKYKSVYGKSYTEVRLKLDKIRSEALVPSKKCNLFVTDILKMWLESRRPFIKESSYAGYRNKLENQIFPYFTGLKYSRLDLNRVNEFVVQKTSEGLSQKYISDLVVMIKSAAKWAEINYGYGNFVRNVPPLKKPVKAAAVFSRDEQRKILTEIRNNPTPTACGILLTMFTGLRIGELCALEWKDIDFNERVLHVTKAVQRISQFGGKAKTNLKVITPKSATSVRDIPLPDFLMKLLENFKGEDDNFVASGSTKICEPRCFTNRYKALLKKANVPSLKFHSLRHTFATNALHQNFDIKTLSEILGHANASITMQVYVHSSMERKAACMSRLQELF